ncbi:hypothetical protein RYX36_026136 [Vicia faba]
MQEIEQAANAQGLPSKRNILNKRMALNPRSNNHITNNHNNMGNLGALTGPSQAALAMSSYQNFLMGQNSVNSSPSSLHREGSPFNNPNQSSSSSSLQGGASAATIIPDSMQNSPHNSSAHVLSPSTRTAKNTQTSANCKTLITSSSLPSSTMPPKVDPSQVFEVGATNSLAPKIGPLGLSPKKIREDITKETAKDWKGLSVTVNQPCKNRRVKVAVVLFAVALVIRH